MKYIYLYYLLAIIISSCTKNPKVNEQPNNIAEDKIINRSARVYLYDKISDTNIFGTKIDSGTGRVQYYRDSLQLFASDDNINFREANDMILIHWSSQPPYISLNYLNQFVSPETTIESFRFNMFFALRWNYKETDSLRIVKDTGDEIRYYTNGKLYKSVPAGNADILNLYFYR